VAIAPLPSLLASVVANAQVTATETATANSTADASLSQANAENLIGANQSAFSLAGAGSVLGGVTANLSATATSTEGNADATAGGLSTANLVGVQGLGDTAAISVNGTGSLQGSVAATLTATATSTAANGSASAGSNDVAGVRAGDILISGAGTIAGLAQLTQGATARSTAGSGNADAQVNQIFGLVVGDEAADLQIGGVGALYGAVSLLSTATAITTGNDAASDSATATQRVGSAIGLDLNGPTAAATSSSIGGAAAITGQAEVTGSANASATTGNSSATAGAFEIGLTSNVIGLRPSESASLRGNGAAVVTAAGSGVFTAQASTSTGGATANVDGNVFGANGTAGQIAIGANGVLNASAVLDATAIASTVDGDGNNASATITPAGGSVIGISLGNTDGGVLINGSGAISGTAQLLQQASATAISGGNAAAQVGNPQLVVSGISTSTIEIDGNSTGFVADAVVNSTATANAGSGTADANNNAGVVADAFKDSVLRIAGPSSGSLQARSAVTDTLRASSVEGNATASAETTRATGIANGSVQVSGQAGTLLSTSTYNLTVDAQSTIANASANGGGGAASEVYGLRDGNVSFGAGGSALFAATTNATINSLSSAGTADSYANFFTKGIEFLQGGSGDNEDISVAGSGSIASQASVLGSVSSTSVAANASSRVQDFGTYGLTADSRNNDISIGGSGTISMSASVGSIESPFLIAAASVSGNADALVAQGGSRAAQTGGFQGLDLNITSQPTNVFLGAGTFSATADTNLSLRAVSTNGNARAALIGNPPAGAETFDSFGIEDANISIQQSLGSSVTGLSNARLDAFSSSTNGNADAILRGQSAGIASKGTIRETIQSSSTIGQAQLLSTSLARTVGGSAVAESGSIVGELVVGINQYDITSAGSGGITAGAAHRAMSTATSVSGSARAQGTL